MSKPLAHKRAVVTGGSQGIGRGICERFLAAGAEVLVADLHAPADLNDWQARCDQRVHWFETNVSASATVNALSAYVTDRWGGLEILVNNAGIMFEKSIDEQTEADWDLMMAVNLKGPFLTTKALLPLMRASVAAGKHAAIVNIGSIEGFAGNPHHTAYCASKGGVHGLTGAMAIDLGPEGIRVNAIAPGWIDTDLNRSYVESVADVDLAKRELAKLHPVGYIGQTSDVGDVAVWLAGDGSRFVSGQVITVDGARTRKLSLPAIFNR